MRGTNGYQITLIVLLIAILLLYGLFFQRELNPEYKVFQTTFLELEKIRGSEAPFERGIKQILIEDKVERCTTCHLALDIPAYNPKSPDYVFNKDQFKTVTIGDRVYDMEKTLVMHPLIGNETRPFEFHPVDQYGCVSCHGGNGRGITVSTAHGPVYDGEYTPEHEGGKPRFLEHDPIHDPAFARMFNEKPDEKLLFQTTPILPGALMEARCVQCHRPNEGVTLEHFERGKELFVEQGCYACHKIESFSRGGIGPELTREGLTYPWFIKESIVWPQADLKSSQMPNQKLDHEQIEDLMTFLLAQRGKDLVTSPMERKRLVRAWENGLKGPLEKEIDLQMLEDVKSGMVTFALEGCAGCHKLQGYTSEVGYKTDAGQAWFRKAVPEDISGSELVTLLQEHGTEIGANLGNVKQLGILDQLKKNLPDYYAPFKYAARAGDWKENLDLIMKAYYQEYGLGRLIGPRPNWSGVYRSDAWLMEHFWNPQSRIPKSLMPAMPFDDTKFRQLTTMLDVIGAVNRDNFRAQKFQPELAYQQLCSQCHGPNLQGNGPVAQWIYPIPMNLRNSEFMRNFTKPQVVQVIEHGVAGTPMAPWGESAKGGEPVLTHDEIEKLADWIFAQLPGSSKMENEVLKWKEPIDVKPQPGNLQEGQKLFLLHCSVCHGTEGDGAGFRAESMQDAKPRMLINVDWINAHDDAWLLRAIQYGVPGTSMIGFGDVTTPEQRQQIVDYIRSLSKSARMRTRYEALLFERYDPQEKELLLERRDHPEKEKELKEAFHTLLKQREALTSLGNLLAEKDDLVAEAYVDYLQTLNRNAFLDKVEDQRLRDNILKVLP